VADRIALVTGAASGIGAAVARQLAGEGVRVALLDINEAAGAELAAELNGEFIPCNVSDYDNFDGAIAACVDRLGAPDYAHLNAGVMTVAVDEPFLALEDVSLGQFRRIMGVNFDGVFNGLKSLLPRMREKGGAITATASVAGLGPLPFDPLYGATKHAVIGIVRAVAAANEGSGIRINCICPGGVDTAIIPDALKAGGFNAMTPTVLAAEVVDLLMQGENGEVRVKVSEDAPAFAVPAMELGG
jgi:NAD(P)-dependent dehydrogenase (short-subunit alcohol dehydrogenase family)